MVSLNQSVPSDPWANAPRSMLVMVNSLMAPAVVIRPMRLVALKPSSRNHKLLSGPTVIGIDSKAEPCGAVNSVNRVVHVPAVPGRAQL